ncbi:hypothetical protein M8C21_018263, partial [Ambrosia artemisiifolia]
GLCSIVPHPIRSKIQPTLHHQYYSSPSTQTIAALQHKHGNQFKNLNPFFIFNLNHPVIYQGFIPLSTITEQPSLESSKHSILLERLRIKHLKDSVGGNNNANKTKKSLPLVAETADKGFKSLEKKNEKDLGFSELGLSEEVLGALGEMGIAVPTEIQRLGIPAVLDEKTQVLKELILYTAHCCAADIARKIYLRGGLGVGVFQRIFGGRNRNGSAPPHPTNNPGTCPRQPGITECGFYDMKFMKEIVHGGVEILGN